MLILQVLIERKKASLDKPFSYLYAGLRPVGANYRVLVPFGSQRVVGYVVSLEKTEETQSEIEARTGLKMKYALSVIDEAPLLNDELMSLADEVSRYYLAPKISVLQAMLPPSLKPQASSQNAPGIPKEKWVELIDASETDLTGKQIELLRRVSANGSILLKDCGFPAIVSKLVELGRLRKVYREKRALKLPDIERTSAPSLTADQCKACDEILSNGKDVTLLQGVTGSGKTEVYLHLSEKFLSEGKNILMLVPEINLTPVMVSYFRSRFQDNVAIIHSGLTASQKYSEYRRIAQGKARVVVGARSAVFAPLSNIGLIILDEEHVESYKQDVMPYYHAREVAIMRGRTFRAKVVLGSATPSLETKARAEKGLYGFAALPKRINDKALPKTTVVDLSDRSNMSSDSAMFSRILIAKIQEKISRHEQVILLMNRRGYSSYIFCKTCGKVLTCPDCGGNLTFHQEDDMMKCHHCGFVEIRPEKCPSCGSASLARVGFGTERVMKEIGKLFPEAKAVRLDSDVGAVSANVQSTLLDFREHRYDILVGTQMVAKGHDFPDVTLVGVILADVGLSLASYRAGERTFELLDQVVGRAGRAGKEGEAIIQTYNPTYYSIDLGAKQDYASFYKEEMETRRLTQYPPYVYLAALSFRCRDENRAQQAAEDFKSDIERSGFPGTALVGPTTPFISTYRGLHTRNLLIKYKKARDILGYLSTKVSKYSGAGGVDISVDVDPIDY